MTVGDCYPPGPSAVPDQFTKPTSAYRRHAWIALICLLLFVSLYLFLTGWFSFTAWRLADSALDSGENQNEALFGSVFAAFLAIFMLKGIVFFARGSTPTEFEVTAEQQPRLFAFLHRLADDAGAPRPKRVFLTPSVNASVFYDLSVLNLLFPSQKNLNIGLGLVNVLTLGQLKAVCAHEFGHFAQRTMAVGRWIYVAQQVSRQVIYKRDALDKILSMLSSTNVRIAWIGWILSLIVWSLRSLLETVFRLVIYADRALSREMELQADLVAVSLTGSDALIEALHRLQAADEAWDQSLAFLAAESAEKRPVKDVFAVQTRVIERVRDLLADASYGNEPPRPEQNPAAHRIFDSAIAQPPRMWLTHPPNQEREENAKQIYIPAEVDPRPAWDVFDDVIALRHNVTAKIHQEDVADWAPIEESLARLDQDFDRQHLLPAYRGVYRDRSSVRSFESATALVDGNVHEAGSDALAGLYPPSLTQDLEQLKRLEKEKALLAAIDEGVLEAPGGIVRYRGQQIPREGLRPTIDAVQTELRELESKLAAHDVQCRSLHRAAAARLGAGWVDYLDGLRQLVHFGDHVEANLRDAQRNLAEVWAVCSATGKVSGSDLDWMLAESRAVHRVLVDIYQSGQVRLGENVARRLKTSSWAELLGSLELPEPTQQNLAGWLNSIDGVCRHTAAALGKLWRAALDELLFAEAQVARQVAEAAPTAPTAPAHYATLLSGAERKVEKRLSWWAKFQTASGVLPAVARTVAALAIVGGALFFGTSATNASSKIIAFNGLARPVIVTVGGISAQLAPNEHWTFPVAPRSSYSIEARTIEGVAIESFRETVDRNSLRYAYNVAGASPLVENDVVYGGSATATPPAPKWLGAPRWVATRAQYLFEDPPNSLSVSAGSTATRTVLTGFALGSAELVEQINDARQRSAAIAAHARWDAADSPEILTWMALANSLETMPQILELRLKADPNEMVALRTRQDSASDREQVCRGFLDAARSDPENGNAQYLAIRCGPTQKQRDDAFIQGYRKWPANVWLANAAGFALAEQGRYSEALTALEIVMRQLPPLADKAIVTSARLRRMMAKNATPAEIDDLVKLSQQLGMLQRFETGEGLQPGPQTAYRKLAQGQLAEAAAAARGAGLEAQITRLVGASEGATAAMIQAALVLPPAGETFDSNSLWAATALAAREGRDLQPYRQAIERIAGKESLLLVQFVERVQARKLAEARQLLPLLPFELQNEAYVCGAVLLGPQTPPDWRDSAKFLLFAAERPFLK